LKNEEPVREILSQGSEDEKKANDRSRCGGYTIEAGCAWGSKAQLIASGARH